MKKKNFILKNTIIISLVGIFLLTLFIIFENSNLRNTIENAYYKNVEDTVLTVRNSITEEKALLRESSQLKNKIPDDMVAFVLDSNEMIDLSTHLESSNLFYFIKDYFLLSEAGNKLIEQKDERIKKIVYQDGSWRTKSFYISVSSIDVNGKNETLILGKDSSVWDTYLLRSRLIFFLLIFIYLGIIFYFYLYQQKRIYVPIKEMTERAFDYSENNFEKAVPTYSNDEIGELATGINKLGKIVEASNLMNIKEKSLLSLVFDSLSVGVIYLDEDLTVTNLNSSGEEYYTFYNKIETEKINDEINAEYKEMVKIVFTTGESKKIEFQYIQSIYEIRFSPLFNEEKSYVKGVLLVIENITEAKRLASIREDLITNVSHDFRTPLATIKGYSEAIIDDIAETTDEKNEMAKIIFDEANELNKTINSLLTLSRMKAGHSELQIQMVRLEPFFMHIISRFTNAMKKNNISYSFRIEEQLEYYQMDEEKMSHVIFNLIDNAIRYSSDSLKNEDKFIKIDVKLDTVYDEILFIFKDNGIGISAESIPYIFERFFKDDKSRSMPQKNGTGIGLSLVHSIVEEHSGKIEVKSKIDRGTTFIIHLPYIDPAIESSMAE